MTWRLWWHVIFLINQRLTSELSNSGCLEEKALETKLAAARDKLTTQIHASHKMGKPYHHLHELRSKIFRRDYYTNEHDILNVVRVAGLVESFEYFEETKNNKEYLSVKLRQKENKDEIFNVRLYGHFSKAYAGQLIEDLPVTIDGVLDSETFIAEKNGKSQTICTQFVSAKKVYVATQNNIKTRPDWLIKATEKRLNNVP